MASLPQYNAEENFRRILMQKRLKFIVVEGVDDVPIYEYVLNCTLSEPCDFDVVHAGGKIAIQSFIESNGNPPNCLFVVDKDFDEISVSSDRLISLDRYSIENYYFCDEVVASTLAVSLRVKIEDARAILSLAEFNTGNNDIVSQLLKAIFFYQKVVVPTISQGEPKPSWSDTFIYNDDGWIVCEEKSRALIRNLIPEEYSQEQIDTFFMASYQTDINITETFPGKMLKTSLQRFIHGKIKSLGVKRHNSKFNNIHNAYDLLTAHLHKSVALNNVLLPVKEFVDNR